MRFPTEREILATLVPLALTRLAHPRPNKLQNVMAVTEVLALFWQATSGRGPVEMAMKKNLNLSDFDPVAPRPAWKGNLFLLFVAVVVLFAVASC